MRSCVRPDEERNGGCGGTLVVVSRRMRTQVASERTEARVLQSESPWTQTSPERPRHRRFATSLVVIAFAFGLTVILTCFLQNKGHQRYPSTLQKEDVRQICMAVARLRWESVRLCFRRMDLPQLSRLVQEIIKGPSSIDLNQGGTEIVVSYNVASPDMKVSY
jgi:hypothetical protein